MSKIFLTIGLSLATVFLFADVSVAENKASEVGQAKKAEMTAEKCASVQNRIEKKVAKYEGGKVRHINSYNKVQKRLETLEVKLREKGYDTTKLKADIAVYSGKVTKFTNDYADYIEKLNETKTLACGHPQDEFKAKLTETRAQMKIVNQYNVEIRTYFAQTIKADLQIIKKQTLEITPSVTP